MATELPTTDQSQIFKQLDEYPWDKDKEFQGGLAAILGPNPQPSQIPDLTIRAQCFYLSRKLSIPIDFGAYKDHLSTLPKPSSPSSPQQEETMSITSPTPQSEPQAPQAGQETPTEPQQQTTTETFIPKTAPYPKSFAEIVELITSGKPIPGIREIITVDRPENASKPVLPKRRKPWETDVPQAQIDGLIGGVFGDERDVHIRQELPDA